MKKKIKKVLIVIGVVMLILIVGVGYFIYQDLKQEDILKQEVIDWSNKDLVNDNFDIEIQTTGDYAYVENAVKKFYKELSDNVKTLEYSLDNDDLINILSLDNLQKDRPSFNHSHQVLNIVKADATKAIENIARLCDKEYVKNLLDKDKVSEYYIDFYQRLMYTEQDLKELKQTEEEMQELSTNLNLFLDKVDEILRMLEKNNSFWFIENNQIYFETDELVNEYNTLYQELKTITVEKLHSNEYSNSYEKHANVS